MRPSDAARPAHTPPGPDAPSLTQTTKALAAFLSERLGEDLARIWERGDPTGPGRPGMAAQVDVVDELLRGLAAGRLPARPELRMLLLAYGSHPDFDPHWHEVLLHR